jgi:hypothetical protein
MSSRRSLWSLLAFGAMSLQASLAFAQVGAPRPERPDRGLYKSTAQDTSDLLALNGSAGVGWDDNILLDLPGNTDPRNATGESGTIINGGGGISYSRTRSKASFMASEASSVRLYPGQTIDHIFGHNASIAAGFAFNDRTRLSASEVVTYQPYTFSSLFPQSLDPNLQFLPVQGPALELAANKTQYLQYTSSVTFNRELSRRTAFYAGYNFTQGDTAYGNGRFTSQGANAGVRWSLTRNLGLRTGYGYQTATYGVDARTLGYHNIDVGVDYNKALSFSRRTTLSFGTGTSALTDGQTTSYHATGDVQLNHEIGRTWAATISYDRAFQFVGTLLEPVFYDAASASVGGLVNRRVRVQTSARASLGKMGLGRERVDNDYDTYQGIATVAIALTRYIDLGVDYTIYRYRFGSGAVLPIGIPRDVERQSISAHIDVWAPLYSRARRNNASR